jgi:hypothetical protein
LPINVHYGLEQVKTEWVLSLDADYIVTDDLISEINALPKETRVNGTLLGSNTVFWQALRSTVLPPREVLFRREKGVYVDDGTCPSTV